MRYTKEWNDYELIDCSNGEKLERWGNQVLIRPIRRLSGKVKERTDYGIRRMPDMNALKQAAVSGIFIKKCLLSGRSDIKI